MSTPEQKLNENQLEQMLAKRKLTPRMAPLIEKGNEGLAGFYTRAEKMGVGRQCLSCGRVRRFSRLRCVCGEMAHIHAKVNSIEKTFEEEVEVFLQAEDAILNPMAHGKQPPADLYQFREYNENGELKDENPEPTAKTKTQVLGVTLEEVVQATDPATAALSVVVMADLKALRKMARDHKLPYTQKETEESLRKRLTEKFMQDLSPPAPLISPELDLTEDSTLTEEELDELTSFSAEKQVLGE